MSSEGGSPVKPPIILDCMCGAGGCTKGYEDAGFKVVGIDLHPQPNYCGSDFIKADALVVLRTLIDGGEWCGYRLFEFSGIHASPPCQAYSVLRHATETKGKDAPELIPETRELLEETGLPWVIENVPGAPLNASVVLCGSMFGLGSNGRQLRRHRLFECSFPIMSPTCHHVGEAIGVYGGGPVGRYTFGNGAKKDYYNRHGGYQGTVAEKEEAMGIDWMRASELNQAIPPAYTEHIGSYLLAAISSRAAA
jgi:DNA (cytosine-5)-methyltransferase 1